MLSMPLSAFFFLVLSVDFSAGVAVDGVAVTVAMLSPVILVYDDLICFLDDISNDPSRGTK